MRTTVTIDPDLLDELRSLARSRDLSFRATLNDVLRVGLAPERASKRQYRVQTRPMHLRPGLDLTHALRLADELDDEDRRQRLGLP